MRMTDVTTLCQNRFSNITRFLVRLLYLEVSYQEDDKTAVTLQSMTTVTIVMAVLRVIGEE